MINVYIVSGFLGAGKTTFIQNLLNKKKFEKVMLLENEFGEVGVDGAFFDSNLNVKEINNGCICCSLQGDFSNALEEIEKMGVSDLIIEPSGVGKLSDILNVVREDDDFTIVSHICIVDVKTAKKYHLNFKDYFDDQVKFANAIIFSHLDVCGSEEVGLVKNIIKEINPNALFNDRNIADYSIEDLLDLIISHDQLIDIDEDDHHHDHEHEHHHDHDHEHHHHHHDHDDDDDDEIFKSMIIKTDHVFNEEELENILKNVEPDIIRIKGYVKSNDCSLFFNYVLNEYTITRKDKREDSVVCVIGTAIEKDKYRNAFHA